MVHMHYKFFHLFLKPNQPDAMVDLTKRLSQSSTQHDKIPGPSDLRDLPQSTQKGRTWTRFWTVRRSRLNDLAL